MTADELREILGLHVKWLRGEPDGKKADLRGANLDGANLDGANLRGADLYGADVHGADLHGADLRGANLGGADLRSANLGGANLYGADLHGADLHGADLRGANLGGADLYGADLHGADLGEIHVVQIGPVGSRRDYLVSMWGPELDVVRTGCFVGSLDAFTHAVESTYPDPASEHGAAYRAAIALLRAMREAPAAELHEGRG